MKLAFVKNTNIKEVTSVIDKIIPVIQKSDIDFDILEIDDLHKGYDFVCALGGDGTVLKTARFYAKTSTPVMGVNLGRLGFLSLISSSDADKLVGIILNKKYIIQERMILKCGCCMALNDVVVKGHSSARTAKFNLFINDNFVSDYIADGIIISTPTGSTAYGLSAGGPVLSPDLDCIEIVPICAHTMNARPLVLPSTEKITIKSSEEYLDVSCDGQENIIKTKRAEVNLAPYKALLAFPLDENFYSILRNKLYWGISPVSNDI